MVNLLWLPLLLSCGPSDDTDTGQETSSSQDTDSDSDTDTDSDTDSDSDSDSDTDTDTDTPPVDSDGDGLSDADEEDIGTDPSNPDSDGGGVNDGDEIALGADPLDASDDRTTIDLSDTDIRYTGRWNFEDPTAPWTAWQGGSMLVKFAGTGLQVTLDAGLRDEWFRIILDEDHLGSTKFEAGSGEADYILAEGLPAGEHTLELVKETYIGKNATLLGMEVTGPGLVSLPPEPSRRLEFYGDSNLAGYSLDHEENNGSSEYVGSHFGYAGIVARMFDASYHNIATSGETLGGMNGRYDQYHWYSDSPKWNHADYPADVVIVNLGANDVGKSVSTIRAAYHSLLDDLRAAHPTAHIVVFNSWGWSYDETANYTGEVVEERNDPNMSVEIFPWVFEQWHGCQYDHGGMALVLAEHLEAVMGWSPNPADVMSGFGRDGDVANGSFEETAPFGGYGWRYIEDGGHTRIADAKAAYDGEHYVQLAGGKTPAEFHQPNPAVNGSQVSATLMLRGGSKGDVAVVTIDFRDQEMWTSALASTTETFALTSSWEAYTLTVTGPEAPARPVFHTRLTVKATPGSTVDVDAISMTTVDP